MSRTTSTVVLSLAAVAISACGSAFDIDDVDPAMWQAMPTWTTDIEPLMGNYCVECHSSRGLRDGGVELDTYDAAFAGSVRNACVSVRRQLAERFADSLMPYPRNPPVAAEMCNGWQLYSMPKGAMSRLTSNEQVILLRWVELGAPR